MELVGYFLLVYAGFGACIWGLARVLPARSYPLLRRLHWLTTGLGLLLLAVPILTLGDWTIKSLPVWGGLLLSSSLLAGIRGRLRLGRAPALATGQAVLVGLLTPLLLPLTLDDSIASDLTYADGQYTVTVNEHVTWMEEGIRYPEVKLYRTRLLFFEQEAGRVHASIPRSDGVAPPDETPKLAAWWRGVSTLSYQADTYQGVAWHDSHEVPFTVNPPYRGSFWEALHASPPASPPAAADPAPPAEDNKVYSYVEHMPGLSGIEGLTEMAAAIERRLVLPRPAPAGQVRVQFLVTKKGEVQQAHIVQGLTASADSAVLAAVRQLPALAPGTQNGQPLNVRLTVAVRVGKTSGSRSPAGSQE